MPLSTLTDIYEDASTMCAYLSSNLMHRSRHVDSSIQCSNSLKYYTFPAGFEPTILCTQVDKNETAIIILDDILNIKVDELEFRLKLNLKSTLRKYYSSFGKCTMLQACVK